MTHGCLLSGRVACAACQRLPDSLPEHQAALVEPTEVAVRAVRKSDLRLAETVAVVGGAPL